MFITSKRIVQRSLTLLLLSELGSPLFIGYGQSQAPMNNGELNIIQTETPRYSISVAPLSNTPGPYGSYCSQYPIDNSLTGGVISSSPYTYYHKDRDHHCPSSLNGDSIGYGLYIVQVDGMSLYVDWRDADYHDMRNYLGSQDIWVYYKHSTHKFYKDQNCTDPINSGTIHIWDPPRKDSNPSVHLIMKNSFYGGTVYVGGVSYPAPSHQIWTTGWEYEVYAPSQQSYMGTTYYFVSWSDGGAQAHSFFPSLNSWNTTLTANYTKYPPAPPPDGSSSSVTGEVTFGQGLSNTHEEGGSTSLDAFPNPFNPSTMIHYWLPSDAYVELEVFNGLGELVACLAKGAEQAGPHRVQFDGTKLASGTYYCRFQVLGKLQTKKVVLLK